MEKKNFKNLFLLQIFLVPHLILGSTDLSENLRSDEEYENVKILINARAGLQFSKEGSLIGRKIVYNCELGLADSGIIHVYDEVHPYDMASLTIKNCYNLTINNYPYNDHLTRLKEIKITNVSFLKLEGYNQYSSTSSGRIKVSISNVQFLDIENFFHKMGQSEISLKLENVVTDTLQDVFTHYHNHKAVDLHLKNTKIKEIKSRAFYLKGISNSILTIEDSHFENIHSNAFVLDGQVKITNNTFDYLDEAAFSVNETGSFLFSGNHVKRMLNPFDTTILEVNIINNTFDSIITPWLPETNARTSYLRLINITGNIINHWSHNLFYMQPNFSDVIIFEGNYLNCSCKNAITVAYNSRNYYTEVFLNKQRKNFCHNLENCPLHKALKLGSGICKGTFQCPPDQNEDDEDGHMWPSHIKSILSVLKSIDTKLDKISAKYNSPLVDIQN